MVFLKSLPILEGIAMGSWPRQREDFIRICRRAIETGMQVSTGGNLSIRLKEGLFLVKPTGMALYDLGEQDLLVTDSSGRTIEGAERPTKEINTHLGIYRVRKDVGGVVHYHSPYGTAYAVCGKTVPLLTVHAKRILGKIPIIPPGEEGSEALSASVQEVFSDPSVKAGLLSGHGILTAGSDLREAQNLAELLEESAKIAHLREGLSGA
jgi:L-ribulose-5-phosphate 4-epimerase